MILPLSHMLTIKTNPSTDSNIKWRNSSSDKNDGFHSEAAVFALQNKLNFLNQTDSRFVDFYPSSKLLFWKKQWCSKMKWEYKVDLAKAQGLVDF